MQTWNKLGQTIRLSTVLIGFLFLWGCLPHFSANPISLKRESTIGNGIYRLNGVHDYSRDLIWSPKGRMLAGLITRSPYPPPDCPPLPIFCMFRKASPSEIFIVDIENLQRRTVYRMKDINPIISRIFWLPDGQHIGYLIYEDGWTETGTWSIDLQGKNEARISEDNLYPYWSPDGSKIAGIPEGLVVIVGQSPTIELIDTSSGERKTIFQAGDKEAYIEYLSWSSDQKSLAFSYRAYGTKTPALEEGAYVLNIASGHAMKIGDDADEGFEHPDFSPLDNLIALQQSRPRFFSRTTVIQDLAQKCEIRLPLESTVSASWSSDGQLLLVDTLERTYIVKLSELIGPSFEANHSICP